jgi:hypothetical protein
MLKEELAVEGAVVAAEEGVKVPAHVAENEGDDLQHALREMGPDDRAEIEGVTQSSTIPREAFESFAKDYEASDATAYVDPKTGKVLARDQLTPWQMIEGVCAKLKTEIKEPKKGCRSCWGRGYIGIDSKAKTPIPCQCIFVDHKAVKDAQKTGMGYKFGRAMKRKLAKVAGRHMTKLRAAQRLADHKDEETQRALVGRVRKKAARKAAARTRQINAHQRKGN